MSTVPQWNADIITQDVEAEAEIQANGGLEKDSSGAIGVNVDNETIVINQDGELEATLSDRDSAYVATYGTTTYQEISAAHTAGKAIFVTNVSGSLSSVMPMTSFSVNPAMAIFMLVIGDIEYQAKIDQDVWSSTSVSLQADWTESNQLSPAYIANKPTVDQVYDSTSTNAQSGTAVAGAIAGVRQVPSTQSSDEGKILGVTDSSGTLGWVDNYGPVILSFLGWQPTMPSSVPSGYVRVRFTGSYRPNSTDLGSVNGIAYMDHTDTFDVDQTKLTNVSSTTMFISGPFEIIGGELIGTSNHRLYSWKGATGLTRVSGITIESTVNHSNSLFYGCTSLEYVETFSLGNITNTGGMFYGCSSLQAVPQFDTSSVSVFTAFSSTAQAYVEGMFTNCTSITTIPLLDTSSATQVNNLFAGCTNVESGALALYTQMSTQTNPPTNHNYTFTNCGANTTTGAAELAQIPTSWGGTMA